MRRFLLDTGIASDYVNRRRGVFERARAARLRGDIVGTTTHVLGELWYGIERSGSLARNAARLKHQLTHWTLWPLDVAAAREFGRLFAELRRLGRPMQQVDVQIAAVALGIGNCTVVTKDSDLAAVPGLDVEDWSAEP